MNTISPANLLPLGVCTARVGDSNLVHTYLRPGNFGRDFRLETEAVFLNRNLLDHLAAEGFVARFHVREVQIRGHVGARGKESLLPTECQ